VTKPKIVLDSSAVLAALNREPGEARVISALDDAVICAVNYSEIVAKLCDKGIPEQRALSELKGLQLTVIPFDTKRAEAAGALRPLTRDFGLSLGDRACLSLAMSYQVKALTADHGWVGLETLAQIEFLR
jgi:ribonuclease VapC